jgi:hypothetical protein
MKNHYTAAQVADGGHLTKPKKAPLLLQAIAWTGILFVTAVGTLIASLIVAVLSLYLFSDDQLFSVFRMTFTNAMQLWAALFVITTVGFIYRARRCP